MRTAVYIGAVVDVDVADAVEVLDHRDARLARQALDQLLAAARDDDVDVIGERHERADRGAVGGVDQLHAGLGQCRVAQAGAHAGSDGAVGNERLRAAAQDAGVAGLDAQCRRVGGHVRPRFVDDAHHAERHAHACHLDAGGSAVAIRDRADRIGERRHRLDALGHLLDQRRVEREPVDESRVAALRVRQVLAVGRQDRRFARPDLARDRRERAILRRRVRSRQLARRGARRRAQLAHIGAEVGDPFQFLLHQRDVNTRLRRGAVPARERGIPARARRRSRSGRRP